MKYFFVSISLFTLSSFGNEKCFDVGQENILSELLRVQIRDFELIVDKLNSNRCSMRSLNLNSHPKYLAKYQTSLKPSFLDEMLSSQKGNQLKSLLVLKKQNFENACQNQNFFDVIDYEVSKTISYKGDLTGGRAIDQWQSPKETLNKLSGDCEDFAILKYWLIKAMGCKNNMYMALMNNVDGSRPHAVLMLDIQDEIIVYDNTFPDSKGRKLKDLETLAKRRIKLLIRDDKSFWKNTCDENKGKVHLPVLP